MAAKKCLTSLKSQVDKLDTDKVKTPHVDLSKPSNIIANDIVKKAVYGKLVTKVLLVLECQILVN